MFRFSIRNLLLSFTFLGLIFAWFVAKDSDESHRRIASVAIKQGGESAVVCMLQSYQWPREQALKFERSIFEVDIELMKTGRLIRQDAFVRNPDIYEPFFWNSQARVVFAGNHILFLDRNQRKLLAQETSAWGMKEIAEFPIGEIKSFDASPDGEMIVFEGITGYHTELDEFEQMEEYLKQQQGLDSNHSSIVPAGFVTTLGVNEPQTLTVEPTYTAAKKEEGSIDELDSVHWIPTGAPPTRRQNLFNWKALIVPKKTKDDSSQNTVAIVGGAASKDMRINEIANISTQIYNEESGFRHRMNLKDADVSLGKVRFAKLLNKEFVVNVKTNEIPTRMDIDISVPLKSSNNSSIRLSEDGKWVAVSRNTWISKGNQSFPSQQICFFDTDQIFKGYVPGMIQQLKAIGTIVSAVEPAFILEFDSEVTTFEFVDGSDLMLVGDGTGRLTLVNTKSKEKVGTLDIPGQPKKLTRDLVLRLGFLWLVTFFGLLIVSHYRKTKIDEDTQMSDSIPVA